MRKIICMRKLSSKPHQSLIYESGAGFTLIEALVYIALFAIIIGGGMVAVYQIIESTNASYNHVILQEEANFLFRKINWALTGAERVESPSSNQLVISDKPGFPPLTFTQNGDKLTLQRSTNAAVELNSGSIAVLGSSLSFTGIDITPTDGVFEGVTTIFTLETEQNGRQASQNFSTTKYLRAGSN